MKKLENRNSKLVEINIQLRGIEKVTETIRAAIIQGMRSGLQAAAVRGQELVGGLIEKPYEEHGPRVAQGLLLSSIASDIESPEGTIGQAVIFAQAPSDVYSGVIEFGRRPGKFPPPDAIRLWLQSPKMQAVVDAVMLDMRAARKGRGKRRSKYSVRERAERMLSFLIGRKIAKKGFPGHFMFERGGQAITPELEDIFIAQIAAALEAGGFGQ